MFQEALSAADWFSELRQLCSSIFRQGGMKNVSTEASHTRAVHEEDMERCLAPDKMVDDINSPIGDRKKQYNHLHFT